MKTTRWDSAKYLKSEEAMAGYMAARMDQDSDDPGRAKSATLREGLYRALAGEGNPSFATLLKLVKALGFKMTLKPA